ncbi:MAG: ZIP family metal transporter [Actinomycetota bacterium]
MATVTSRIERLPAWVGGLIPLVLVAALLGVFLLTDPIGELREVPPVEAVAVERTVLETGEIELHVRNDGPDPVTIAQVLVDDAYWDYTIGDSTLGRLEGTTVRLTYPWDEDLPLNIKLVTATGVTIEHEIEVAAVTPDLDSETLRIYGLLGVYIGVIPVAVGLLWFPALRRASRRWLGFFLAVTIGLLAFLLVDTIAEGLELAGEAAGAFDGVGLFASGALAAVAALTWIGAALTRRRAALGAGLVLAYLIAAGIGLHNLGEGLAVGAALAAGEIALGTFLVVGFALHNTTEGLAIVAPLGTRTERPALWHFIALGALAGVPTVFGAWLGGFAFSPAPGALAFGIAAGAIAQVIWSIARSMASDERGLSGSVALGFVVGLAVMYVTGLFAA